MVSSSFKQFDVVSGGAAIDNHFYKGSAVPTTKPSPALHKKIMQEWRILDAHLPDSIFVRVHEHQIDLLRAAIIGAAGTPYHDSLFLFDLSFPSDYPRHPPNVHFHAHGIRLNPNLYASGKVCLSLLNTWTGRKSELWNPKESTILQVLVSIQALVLNSKPFFNEPGTGIFWNWETQSRAYSESVFVLACKTTAYIMKNPPRYFEDFVVDHFRQRARRLLGACKAYAEGRVRVGEYYEGCLCENGGERDETVSLGEKNRTKRRKKKGHDVARAFRESLKAVYKEMVREFGKKGISVEGFGEVLVLDPETTAFGGENDKKNKNNSNNNYGIVKWFVEKMKSALGLKKKEKKAIRNGTGLVHVGG